MSIGDPEYRTQQEVIDFFCDSSILDYTYLGDLRDRANKNIDTHRLKNFLKLKGYSDKLCEKAIEELVRTAGGNPNDLYTANKNVYMLLKYGAKVKESPEAAPKTVYFFDFENPKDNDFTIGEEVTVVGRQEKRPDIVIYINGIAVAVLELKKCSVSVAYGIRQNLTNQKESYIGAFFSTVQFCMAGNETEGLRYGTILTKEKYYLEWKPDGFTGNEAERDMTDIRIADYCEGLGSKLKSQLYSMFDKERFMDLMHNFIVFDKGVKKICRYNQFYGVKRAQSRWKKHENGIIWHHQGSGKTLTMVWLSKWILSNYPNARILIITDREELDEQVEKSYKGVDENIVRTVSGEDLINRLNQYDDSIICSLIHKFGRRGGEVTEADYDRYIEEIYKALPEGFSAKGDVCVFVDECHRTQSGKLHKAMKAIMPDAVFFGFTGTPLLKKDKPTSIEVFGTFIHTYKYNEAVADGVVLDLRYEYRDIPQELTSQDRIDQWFEIKTKGLSPRGRAKLKQKWGTMQKVYSSRSRLEKIAWDIMQDFDMKPRLMDGNGNAILVADSIYSACKYYEIFQSRGFRKCAIVSSYTPLPSLLRTDTVSDEDDTENAEKQEIYYKMLGLDPNNLPEHTSIRKIADEFEKEVKQKFIEQPANMKLLIVVDKLLTGFDVPHCTYLYVDKSMHDHGLFQAVCRVNRLDDESKEFGFIVDYKQLFGDLKDALNAYTAGAFEDYDEEDVEGFIKDRGSEALKHFKHVYDELEALCDGVEEPKESDDYMHYFCGKSETAEVEEIYMRLREKLYSLVNMLVRAFAEAKPYLHDLCSSEEISEYDRKVAFYIDLKGSIGNGSGDFLDYKAYEPDMRKLIDNFIMAFDSKKIGEMDDFTLLDFITQKGEILTGNGTEGEKNGAAEAIENNIRRKIVERLTINPKYYDEMSAILAELINERKKGVRDYEALLKQYARVAENVETPETNTEYPESIRGSKALQALYDNTGRDEALALKIHMAVLTSRMSGFREDETRARRIQSALYDILQDDDEVERVFEIIVNQEEY